MAETKVYLGIALELAGKTIALEPKNAINELKTKGIEVELPPGERVYLGTVGQSLGQIFGTLGVANETTAKFLNSDGSLKESELPHISALKKAATLVTGAGLYVDQFHVRILGTEAKAAAARAAGAAGTTGTAGATTGTAGTAGATTGTAGTTVTGAAYTVGLSAEWLGDAGNLIDGLDLKLRGIYFKVSNEE